MNIVEGHHRFVLQDEQGKEFGEVTYSVAGEALLIIDHTFVDPSLRGQHFAEKLVKHVVDKARAENKKIIPLCPFAKKEFDTKPEYRDVLN